MDQWKFLPHSSCSPTWEGHHLGPIKWKLTSNYQKNK